jgi:hypothetical protein
MVSVICDLSQDSKLTLSSSPHVSIPIPTNPFPTSASVGRLAVASFPNNNERLPVILNFFSGTNCNEEKEKVRQPRRQTSFLL